MYHTHVFVIEDGSKSNNHSMNQLEPTFAAEPLLILLYILVLYHLPIPTGHQQQCRTL
jgi:hypothetical protein